MSSTPDARDFNREHRDGERKYSYDFDGVLRRYMMRTLDPFLRPGRALEMGCYRGEMTELLAERFADLTVVEASDELVLAARSRLRDRARFVTDRFETVSFDVRFDNVFLVHTLEHLDAPVDVLARVDGWLADRGRLFIVVPNANAPSRQIAVQMGLLTHNTVVTPAERAHGHRCTYTLDTLERDARAAGLTVVDRGGIFFKPLANYQFDRLLGGDVITEAYLEGCYGLGSRYPDLCASIYLVCERGGPKL